jgi:hypothetical protein
MSEDRTVIVDRGGSGATAIVAIVVVLLIAAVAWWFLLGPGAGSRSSSGTDINVNLPSIQASQPASS